MIILQFPDVYELNILCYYRESFREWLQKSIFSRITH